MNRKNWYIVSYVYEWLFNNQKQQQQPTLSLPPSPPSEERISVFFFKIWSSPFCFACYELFILNYTTTTILSPFIPHSLVLTYRHTHTHTALIKNSTTFRFLITRRHTCDARRPEGDKSCWFTKVQKQKRQPRRHWGLDRRNYRQRLLWMGVRW